MLKKIELIILLFVIAGLFILNQNIGKSVVSEDVDTEEYVVVIDAGHGGRDPGKVGVNDILEKDLNLQIAKKVKMLLEKEKIKVIMTREEDEMLGEESADNKKLSDMKERVKIMNEAEPDLVVSIHQNSFSDSSVSGAQVFYHTQSEEGKLFAESIQKALIEAVPDNKRQAKDNDSYYLLKYTDAPVVIVECGFLSNPEEVQKLVEDTYQDKISNAIVNGIESCFMN